MPSARRVIPTAIATAAIVATAAAMTATSAPRSRASQPDSVRAIERSRLHALVAADVAAARKLTAADFQLINPAGDPLSRDDLLGGVKAGAIDFLAIEPISQIVVRRAGKTATLRYRARFDLVAGGTRLTHDAWTTVLYERRHGRWRVVWEQTTAIPNDPELFLRSLLPKS
jgi:hypothetical protein